MLSRQLLRTSTRALRSAGAALPRQTALLHTQPPMATPPNKDKRGPAPPPGSFARTDDSITVEYPEEGELPSSTPVTGRGGMHMKRTLASFSLEGKVGVVTGGARGLGLVMGQGMVISGANLALVDMNSERVPFPILVPVLIPTTGHLLYFCKRRVVRIGLANTRKQRRKLRSKPSSLSKCSARKTQARRACPR